MSRTIWPLYDIYTISHHPDHNKGQQWGLRLTGDHHPYLLRGKRDEVEAYARAHFKLRKSYNFEHPRFEKSLTLPEAVLRKLEPKQFEKDAANGAERRNQRRSGING